MRRLAALWMGCLCSVAALVTNAAGSERFSVAAQGMLASAGVGAAETAPQHDVLTSSQLAPPRLDEVRHQQTATDDIERYLRAPRIAAAPSTAAELENDSMSQDRAALPRQPEKFAGHATAEAATEEDDALLNPWMLGAAALAATGGVGSLGLLWQKRRRRRRLQAAGQAAAEWSRANDPAADSLYVAGQQIGAHRLRLAA